MTTDITPTIQNILRQAGTALGSRLEAEILLAHVLGKDRGWLYAYATSTPDEQIRLAFADLLERRQAGEPIAYLSGKREFFGRDFLVNCDVLIPRPETEHLVEQALALVLPMDAKVVDVGTGSGCIALTLAAERPAWHVMAVDLCPKALAVARRNRDLLRLDKVEIRQGDLLDGLSSASFDLIVSNPPYVADGDPHLNRGDLCFEPSIALSCGENGLALIARLARQASSALRSGGWLVVEHGHEQGEQVGKLFAQAGFQQVESCRDLAGLPRVSLGQLP
ncbi:MAG: peptide chain release factor N(5)-glutamine methyltransferase [Wenzhouxiangella sp.]|nr:peptide chain release factor N(5)-glutamine methyltransferase [Wenzhouxiangella sp.]